MRPSNAELLESIAQALEDQVGPLVQDQWAASTLRSAVQLLRHVAIRGVREPGLLAEDRADVRSVLEAVRARLAGAGLPELEHAVTTALGVAAREPADAAAAAGCDDACLSKGAQRDGQQQQRQKSEGGVREQGANFGGSVQFGFG